jgi:hypothetical protein
MFFLWLQMEPHPTSWLPLVEITRLLIGFIKVSFVTPQMLLEIQVFVADH